MKVRGKVSTPSGLVDVEFEISDDSPEAKALMAGMSFTVAPAVETAAAKHPSYKCPNLYGCALCGPEVSE